MFNCVRARDQINICHSAIAKVPYPSCIQKSYIEAPSKPSVEAAGLLAGVTAGHGGTIRAGMVLAGNKVPVKSEEKHKIVDFDERIEKQAENVSQDINEEVAVQIKEKED